MVKLSQLLSGMSVLYETRSSINGKVEVVKDLAWGTSIRCDGLTQSGGIVEGIWKRTLTKIQISNFCPKNSLVLGLGGGTTAKLLRKKWPQIEIEGVDLDPIMIDLGKKYLKLNDYCVTAIVGDAYKFVLKSKKKYDLVLVDVYQGRNVPKQFDTQTFAKSVNKLLSKEGVAIFNRLYYGEKRPLAMKFLASLEKEFTTVSPVYPQANVMFICHR